jgi:DNA-binding NarL/FixJ family response regulator
LRDRDGLATYKPKKNIMKNVRRNSAGTASEGDALETDGSGNAKQLSHQLAKDISSIVFMDTDLPGLTPAEAANLFKAAYPEMNVVLFSLRDQQASKEIIQHQAVTSQPPATLSDFFKQVYEAALQSNNDAVQKVWAFFNRNPEISGQYGLSARELQVLDCLVNGDTYKLIAEHCHISVGTVRSHIMNIYRKLDVNSRSGAIVKAMQERITGS